MNAKIHCKDQDDIYRTDCGRRIYGEAIVIVGGWIFDRLKDEHKCKRCKKKEDSRV